MNTGRTINNKVVTQNSADAAATAGAGWMARSMNTVAMNNVAMARLIAVNQILDAMPLTVQFTTEDQTAIWVAMNDQLARGVSDVWLRDAITELRDEVREELDILEPMNDLLNRSSYDIREMTYCNGPSGRGRIWRALEGLDEYSQATMENIGPLAQLNGAIGGEINLRRRSALGDADSDLTGNDDEGGLVVMFPLVPDVPWERGTFDDFRWAVHNGLLPEHIDHKEFNRGPWDAILGWRYRIGGRTNGYWVGRNCTRTVTSGGRGTVPIGRGVSSGSGGCSGGRFVVTSKEEDRYGVYGPFSYMMRRVTNYGRHNLPHSRFSNWASAIARPKLNYLWGSSALRRVTDPEWITSFDDATQIADAGTPRIVETAFVAVEIKSKYPRTHPAFGSTGTWAYAYTRNRNNPRVQIVSGWMDPRDWGVTKVTNHIWRDEWTYNVVQDTEISIPRQEDAAGNPIEHTVYRIDDFAFVGVNIGTEVDIRNPNPSDRSALPRPTQLNHSLVTRSDDSRREYLTVLAVTQYPDRALLWPRQFRGDKPDPNMVSIAQANVFNNHSFDIYTQMWHAQLTTVTDYHDWVTRMQDDVGDSTERASETEITDLVAYLEAMAAMSDVALSDHEVSFTR